jgi:hypothetical protein
MIDSIVGTDSDVLAELCGDLTESKFESFEKKLNGILVQISSYHDFSEKENSYHNLLLGALLFLLDKFKVHSNRESGHGRYDIALIPVEAYKEIYKPIVIEFKVPKISTSDREYTEDELFSLAEMAVNQICEKKYYAQYADIYSEEDFIKVGIAAQGKRCRVMAVNG